MYFFLKKKFFFQKSFCLGTPGNKEKKFFFLTKLILFDVVYRADFEYQIHFARKSTFTSHNLEIPTHFPSFLRVIPVFPRFYHVLHFFSNIWSHIRIEHEKLHRSEYISHWIKNLLGKKLAYTS